MDKDKQKAFARRIAEAGRTGLLVITYEILLEEMDEAIRFAEAGDIASMRRLLKSAQRYLAELMRTLDYRYALSLQLLSLYEYVQRILVRCDIRGENDGLADARRVIEGLRSAYAQIEPGDTEGPMMSNTQAVYAGLTYSKGSLNETQIDPAHTGRGFYA